MAVERRDVWRSFPGLTVNLPTTQTLTAPSSTTLHNASQTDSTLSSPALSVRSTLLYRNSSRGGSASTVVPWTASSWWRASIIIMIIEEKCWHSKLIRLKRQISSTFCCVSKVIKIRMIKLCQVTQRICLELLYVQVVKCSPLYLNTISKINYDYDYTKIVKLESGIIYYTKTTPKNISRYHCLNLYFFKNRFSSMNMNDRTIAPLLLKDSV